MAALTAPTRNPITTIVTKISQHKSPLQILLQMGFPKNRALKALAATGNNGVQLASAWLLHHIRDPFLDHTTLREYVLYACPIGAFSDELHNFWNIAKASSVWNGEHYYTPHISLVSFFKASDKYSLLLEEALESVMQRQGATLNESLKFETRISQYSMGFFVAEEHADHLKRIGIDYIEDVLNIDYVKYIESTRCCFPMSNRRVSATGIHPVQTMQLELTLAYQFHTGYYAKLKRLLEFLGTNPPNEWEIRLYSRDPRVAYKHVHKVVKAYSPQKRDELKLHIDDYIYLSCDAVVTSKDGWHICDMSHER